MFDQQLEHFALRYDTAVVVLLRRRPVRRVARIIDMVGGGIAAVQKGRLPSLEPVTVTTDLGRMFHAIEIVGEATARSGKSQGVVAQIPVPA